MIACFIFAVYAKHKVEEGAISYSDIIKVLPPRYDDENCFIKEL